jgi:hypothetical protein
VAKSDGVLKAVAKSTKQQVDSAFSGGNTADKLYRNRRQARQRSTPGSEVSD